jgi:putative endonuclease
MSARVPRVTATDEPRAESDASEFWYVYIVRCADSSLYTGVARDVRARVAAHNAGRGARYTRARGPVHLCKTRRCENKSLALRLEYAVKQLSRAQKDLLLEGRALAHFATRFARSTQVTNHVTCHGWPAIRDTRARFALPLTQNWTADTDRAVTPVRKPGR